MFSRAAYLISQLHHVAHENWDSGTCDTAVWSSCDESEPWAVLDLAPQRQEG